LTDQWKSRRSRALCSIKPITAFFTMAKVRIREPSRVRESKPKATWDRATTCIPAQTETSLPLTRAEKYIRLYNVRDLDSPGTIGCTLKTVAFNKPTPTRFMGQAITIPLENAWFRSRILETVVTDEHREIYRHALECMRQAIQSPQNRLIQDQHTGGWKDYEDNFVPANARNQYANWYYYYPEAERIIQYFNINSSIGNSST
jgi:hypothetical protein